VDVLNILEEKLNFQTNLTIFGRHFSKNEVSSENFPNFIDRYYISPQLTNIQVKAYILVQSGELISDRLQWYMTNWP